MIEKPKDLLCLEGISCLSFNQDQSFCVLSKKDSNLYIYETPNKLDTKSWKESSKLTGHLQYISAVDWHPQTNRIISSSHDRNILVWTYNKDKKIWLPDVVNLKVKVSILDVKWSPRGDKFVATTGSKLVANGYYEEELKMWNCLLMKEHKSSVTTARFDRSGMFILSGSTDLKGFISSAYIEHIDDEVKYENLPFEKVESGTNLMKLSFGAWVNAVAWSPNSKFAFVATHDANLTIINLEDKSQNIINLTHAPISHILPISDNSICAIAFDRHIYQYSYENNNWIMKKCITKESFSNTQPTSTSDSSTLTMQDRLKAFSGGFQKKQSLIITSVVQNDIHQANINSAHVVNEKYIITSDYAGFVKVWNI